jgi:hypothetical protein
LFDLVASYHHKIATVVQAVERLFDQEYTHDQSGNLHSKFTESTYPTVEALNKAVRYQLVGRVGVPFSLSILFRLQKCAATQLCAFVAGHLPRIVPYLRDPVPFAADTDGL